MATAKAPSELLDRVPPHNVEAERGVLGSILLDNEVLHDLVPVLRPEHFYQDAHQRIYQTIRDLYDQGAGGIDEVTLVERLRSQGQLEDVGGVVYLADVIHGVPHAANAEYYARIVRDKATLRELIHAGTEILRNAYDVTGDAQELLQEAERRIFRILEQTGDVNSMEFADILREALNRINSRLGDEGMICGLPTGFLELDQITSGLQDSELIVIAARPSVGKTAFAVNIAEHVAMEENAPVLIFSLEQSRLELAERLLCSRARVDGHKLRSGHLSGADHRKLADVSGELSRAPIFIDDTPGRSMLPIAAIARRYKRREKLRLVIIDYLQLVEPDNRRDSRQEQIANIARRLKHMARELNIPVIALAQLNRGVEMRETHTPRLSDLRESGAIEQDADVVMFLHRPEMYIEDEAQKDELRGQAKVIVAKQRNGPTGTVTLTWLREWMRFEPFASIPEPQAYFATAEDPF